jgi:hypothetical protein
MTGHWIWKAAAAGLCGSVAHSLLMYLKSRLGLLPSFQPYESLQLALDRLIGGVVHPIVAVFAIRTANWRISAHSTLT